MQKGRVNSQLRPVGEIIREKRENAGWSLAKLGRVTELDSGYLSKLETGKVDDPGFKQIRRIAAALKIPCCLLFSEEEYLPELEKQEATSKKIPSTSVSTEIMMARALLDEYLALEPEEQKLIENLSHALFQIRRHISEHEH